MIVFILYRSVLLILVFIISYCRVADKFSCLKKILVANLVERSTVNTNDILVLGEKINDSLIVSE